MTISPENRFRPRLVIMAKAPVAGRVKTRLGRDIGMVPAAWWFRHQVMRTFRNLTDRRWETVLAISPDNASFPGLRNAQMGQGHGDLGARMARIFRTRPPGPVVIVGADIPGMTPGHIARAFRELGGHDAVFGPATDGGFWLVGLKRARAQPPGLFACVRWSTPHALADSMATLPGWRISLADRLADVDYAADMPVPANKA